MPPFSEPRFRILIAEDDRVSAKILQSALESLGHSWVWMPDGGQAWETIRSEPYPVVITDWVMPGLEGPELCHRIRCLPGRKYCYVILVTSKDQKQDRVVGLEAGADDFITKPVDREDLRARLAVASRILEMQDRLEAQKTELESSTWIAETSRQRFSQLFEGMPIACFTYDAEGTVFEWNHRAVELFRFDPLGAMGRRLWDLMGPDMVGEAERATLKQVFADKPFVDEMWADGTRYLMVSGLPLRGYEGAITGGILSAVDVTEQKQAQAKIAQQFVELEDAHRELSVLNARLAALATTDALTGIPNHRALQDRLAALVQEARRGRAFALAMVDVDHFKKFNDEFGHQAGDQVLATVAGALAGHVRPGDFVARYGGEEFCVLFPDADSESALALAEQLRAAVERIETPHRKVTASFGVSLWSPALEGASGLIQAADAALYRAKREGRNRVAKG